MRIGALYESNAASNYRINYPLQILRGAGHETIWPDREGNTPIPTLRTCDAVIVYRRCGPNIDRALSTLRDEGVAIVWDNDDDLYSMPKARANRRATGVRVSNQRLFAMMIRTARIAHAVTLTNPTLEDVFTRAGVQRITVLPNMLPNAEQRPRTRHEGLTIGWIAGWEHHPDAMGLRIPDVLRRLMAEHPHVNVTCVGVDLGLRERYAHARSVHFDKLIPLMGEFDIGLAPLLDTPFNRSRSDIKVKEYAASAVPWLASAAGPYLGLGEDQGGRLVQDGEWYEALDALIRDAGARERLARRGREWAATQTMATMVPAYETVIADAVERATGNRPAVAVSTGALPPARKPAQGERFAVRLPQKLVRQGARGGTPRA
jgi:glycosyltransferase involved in cell wall biosynthesis